MLQDVFDRHNWSQKCPSKRNFRPRLRTCAAIMLLVLTFSATFLRKTFGIPVIFFHRSIRMDGLITGGSIRWGTADESANLLQCMERLLKINGKDHQKEKLRILMVGDSRIRQQFNSLLNFLPDYDRSWHGQLFDRELYHTILHVDSCTTSNILNLELCYWWRPIFDGLQLSSEIQNWSTNGTMSSGRSFLILGIGAHYFADLPSANHANFTQEMYKIVEPLQRIIENKNGTLSVAWMLNQIMHSTMRGKYKLHSYAQNKIVKYNEIVRKAFKRYENQIQVLDINPVLAEQYVSSCQASCRSDLLDYFQCEHPVHLGFVLIDENTRFLIKKFFCAHHAHD